MWLTGHSLPLTSKVTFQRLTKYKVRRDLGLEGSSRCIKSKGNIPLILYSSHVAAYVVYMVNEKMKPFAPRIENTAWTCPPGLAFL